MQKLKVSQVRTDGGTQMRVGPRNQEAVREYADVLKDGGSLPPVTVFFDGRDYWLADGFHRHSAHLFLSLPDIETDVREGTKRDAILFAVGANASHGLRRTNADKRRAVEALLKDEEWSKWTDAEIARRAAVSAMTVGRARQELISNKVIDAPTERIVQRGGTTFTQNTANIGQRPPTPAAVERQPPVDTRPAAPSPAPVPESGVPPLPARPAAPVAEPDEPVLKPEDLYIPFMDPPADPMEQAEAERRVKALHNSLERLLKEKEGRYLLSQPDPYTRSVRSLAHMAREMLDDWLDSSSDQDSRTITIDALN